MNINAINSSQNFSFNGKEKCLKEFNAKLFGGNKAKICVNLNEGGNPRMLEYYEFNKQGNLENARGICRYPKLKLTEIFDFVGKINENSSENILSKLSELLSH